MLSFLSLEESGLKAHQDNVVHSVSVGVGFSGNGFLKFLPHHFFIKEGTFLIPINSKIGHDKSFSKGLILELPFGPINKNGLIIFIDRKYLKLLKGSSKRVLVVDLIFVSDMNVFDGNL